jgi:tetratricopeptide (TPR) repeat protein
VRSILKALGMTIWGSAAVLLSVIFIIVAFQVAMKYRASRDALDVDRSLSEESTRSQAGTLVGSVALPERALPERTPDLPVPQIVPRTAMATDCARRIPRIALDSPQRARLFGFLNSTEAAKAESGDAFVWLGQRYYGFGEYELAIASIERGLEKGHVEHVEEAYVYLGRSEAAIGELDAAREAFAKLKDVPGISPRLLKLWTLYAETRLGPQVQAAIEAGECQAARP